MRAGASGAHQPYESELPVVANPVTPNDPPPCGRLYTRLRSSAIFQDTCVMPPCPTRITSQPMIPREAVISFADCSDIVRMASCEHARHTRGQTQARAKSGAGRAGEKRAGGAGFVPWRPPGARDC